MNNTLKIIGLVGALAVVTSAQAEKERGSRPSPEEIFAKLDADENGAVTYEEFKLSPKKLREIDDDATAEEMKQTVFSKIDANSDEQITLEEFQNNRPEKKGRKK